MSLGRAALDDSNGYLYDGCSVDPRVVIVSSGSFGNGFFVAPWRDIVVTAYHVVEGSSKVRVEAESSDPAHETMWFAGTVLAWDELRDLAVIRLVGSVSGLTLDLTVERPAAPLDAVLQGYQNYAAWSAKPRMWTPWQPVLSTPVGDWLHYGTADSGGTRHGSPGVNGFSGSAVLCPDSNTVVGVHHGARGIETNRAACIDRDIVDALRNKAYEID
jgi:hypothetical protein